MQLPQREGLASALPLSGIRKPLFDWRLPPIETYPSLVGFAQTHAGKFLLFGTFAVLMKLVAGSLWWHGIWLQVTIAAALVSLAGRFKRYVALICVIALLVRWPFPFGAAYETIRQEELWGTIQPGYLRAATMIACVSLGVAAIFLVRHFRDSPLGRRPVLAQHILYFCILGFASSRLLDGLPQILLWSMVATFSAYFWYLAYALLDQRHGQAVPILYQFASFYPTLGLTLVPWGKGSANWRSVEEGTARELAVTQLKGLKLLAWAGILNVVLWAFREIIYGNLGVTRLRFAFEQVLNGDDAHARFGLSSIIANFPEQLLTMAVWGHVVVAVARLAGFRLLRNTCRPLSSRTIAEFWNRYFYYFKEMLVNVYFYPTYVRCFKRHPRLRLAFATFMAAGVGNYFLHFILDHERIAKYGLVEALIQSQTYAFYCVMLVCGIVLSQLRARRPDASADWLRGRFLPSLGVAVFFCFLSFFDGPQGHFALSLHFEFLFKVFGIDRWILTIG